LSRVAHGFSLETLGLLFVLSLLHYKTVSCFYLVSTCFRTISPFSKTLSTTSEKLSGKNYLSWFARVELWFLGQGFPDHLEDGSTIPPNQIQ